MKKTWLLSIAVLAMFACENQNTAKSKSAATAADEVTEPGKSVEPTKPKHPELAGEPVIDLLANRHRFHIYDEGLIIPFASEGLRKYDQVYARQFGDVEDGGRTVKRSRVSLTFPWDMATDTGTMRLWSKGAGQVQVRLNGEYLGTLNSGSEWTEDTLKVKADVLKAGENEISLEPKSRGGARLHSLEIAPGEVGKSGEKPRLNPRDNVALTGEESRQALVRLKRHVIWVEVPANAWLDVHALGKDMSVVAQTFDGEPKTLLTGLSSSEWTRHTVKLDEFAKRLVRLEFRGVGAWGTPRIALEPKPAATLPKPYDNVILLVVDALRSDHLKLYDPATPVATPHTTKQGTRGVVFLNNQAASPSSPPSHGSIQTGMIPRVHGVAGDKDKLNPGTPMISSVLSENGVATAYYGNNPFGMGRLEKPGKWTEYHYTNGEGKGIDCSAIVDGILDFSERQSKAGKRFFISSLPYEPHTPYRYHEGITDKYLDKPWKSGKVGKSVDGRLLSPLNEGRMQLSDQEWNQLFALYDGEVEHWDNCFGDLMAGLDKLGLTKSTAIVLTSDHGEGMYEHGNGGHAWGHFREIADVPFVIFADGLVKQGPLNIETVTGHVDIAPTVLDLMGVEVPTAIQGQSVLPIALRGGEWTPQVMSLEYGRSFALRSHRYKIITEYNGSAAIYDLVDDPGEKTDITETRPFVTRYMRDLVGFFLEHRSEWKAATWGTYGNHTEALAKRLDGR